MRCDRCGEDHSPYHMLTIPGVYEQETICSNCNTDSVAKLEARIQASDVCLAYNQCLDLDPEENFSSALVYAALSNKLDIREAHDILRTEGEI